MSLAEHAEHASPVEHLNVLPDLCDLDARVHAKEGHFRSDDSLDLLGLLTLRATVGGSAPRAVDVERKDGPSVADALEEIRRAPTDVVEVDAASHQLDLRTDL